MIHLPTNDDGYLHRASHRGRIRHGFASYVEISTEIVYKLDSDKSIHLPMLCRFVVVVVVFWTNVFF
jgi:hypothetical protein